MATGTGKTRVVIALTDLLMRANRAKRILFLESVFCFYFFRCLK